MQRILLLALALVARVLLPVIVLGQTINMGGAAPFCLFTRTGAMGDNNATSKSGITGRLGTHTGDYTGFNKKYNSAAAGGTPQHETDSLTLLQIANDVGNAIRQIGTYANSPVALRTTLGGLTVTPGVYDMPSAVSLSGDLILDGQGQTNPLFIFKVGGAFTTTSPYRVLVINGAVLDNVYWQMSGAVSLSGGSTSIFRGIILATPAGAINLADGATLLGKALTQAGAINLDNNQINNADLPAAPLPVELTAFAVERQATTIRLSWTTASEKNNAYFALERSTDGRVFTCFGHVAGHGSSTQPHAYASVDVSPTQGSTTPLYYRLRQVDADSTSYYSAVRAVVPVAVAGLKLQCYPNPSQGPLSLRIDVLQAGPATLRLTNAQGRLVLEKPLALLPGSTTLVLDDAKTLRPGLYLVQLQQGGQQQTLTLTQE